MERSLAERKSLHKTRLQAMEQRHSEEVAAVWQQQQDALSVLGRRRMAQFNDMRELWDKQFNKSEQRCELLTAELQSTEKAAEAKLANVCKKHADELENIKLQLSKSEQSAATQLADTLVQVANAVAAGNAQLERSDKQRVNELALLKTQDAEQSKAQQAKFQQQLADAESAHHAELDALRKAHISETEAMLQTAEAMKQELETRLADSASDLKQLRGRTLNMQTPYGVRNYWLQMAEDAKAECKATTSQLQDKWQRSEGAAQAAQLAQQQAESKAAELLRKQRQSRKDSAHSVHQLEQAHRKFEAELGAAAAHHAEQMSAKEAELKTLKEVSGIALVQRGMLCPTCAEYACPYTFCQLFAISFSVMFQVTCFRAQMPGSKGQHDTHTVMYCMLT